MRLCVFEDAGAALLEPLSLTRPVWSLRCGAQTLLERQLRVFPAVEVGGVVRPEFVALCHGEQPGFPVNDAGFLQGNALVFVNARWLPPLGATVDCTRAHVGVLDGQVAYVVAPPPELASRFLDQVQPALEACLREMPSQDVAGAMIDYLWDLVNKNPNALTEDWEWFQKRPRQPASHVGSGLVGPPEKLVVSESAVVEPFVFVDTRQGPVLIDDGAVVHSFSRLEGPCYIGKESWIVGAKLRGGTIGPKCRIGGEVEASIVQGHSNKYHDGFLGHSYIGEWVNLAAGTQTSDLRNDYGMVRVTVAGRRVTTGLNKVGSFIGDHSKTGLGALLNTGSAIGAFCNLLPAGNLLPQVVPSFCQVHYGQIREQADMRQLFTTAATVMQRRGETFTDVRRDFCYALFDQTAELRHSTIRDSEMRNLRRSV